MGEETVKKALEAALGGDDPGKVSSALKRAFLNAIELTIKTTVTEEGPKAIETRINLLEGDIETTIHHDFAPDPEQVAEFHKAQVNKAEQIIEKNVNTLQAVGQALLTLL